MKKSLAAKDLPARLRAQRLKQILTKIGDVDHTDAGKLM
jgi:hypothetical protein